MTQYVRTQPCYEGFKSFQPIAVCWAETGLVLADEFREGNVPASMDNRRLVDEAYQALPVGAWEIWVRSDAAGYGQGNLDHWDSQGWKFAVSASMSPQLRAVMEAVPDDSWRLMEDKRGAIREWAEVDYVPKKKNEKREAKPYRYVGLRLRRQQGELFGDGASVRYFAVVSNIWEMDGQALLQWHRGKAGTIEHVHHIIKSELGGGVYPSGKHGANAEPKRLRFAVFTGLGQIAHHARRVILKILEELWATLIRAAQERAMTLSPPVC